MKIVFTGGPGAGKTSMIELLFKSYAGKLWPVPEAASLLFRGGFPRHPSNRGRRCQEVAIYYVQRELERLAEHESEGRALLCDRGSLDALAYWPAGEKSFFDEVNSSMEMELARYDWVIHLESTGNAPPSAMRIESDEESFTIDAKLSHAWRFHRNRIVIKRSHDFLHSLNLTTRTIDLILSNHGRPYIEETLARLHTPKEFLPRASDLFASPDLGLT